MKTEQTTNLNISASKDHRVTVRRTTDGESHDVVTVEPGDSRPLSLIPGSKNAFSVEIEDIHREGLANVEHPHITSDLPAGEYASNVATDGAVNGPAAASLSDAPLGMSNPEPVDKGTVTAKEPKGAAKAAPKAKAKPAARKK